MKRGSEPLPCSFLDNPETREKGQAGVLTPRTLVSVRLYCPGMGGAQGGTVVRVPERLPPLVSSASPPAAPRRAEPTGWRPTIALSVVIGVLWWGTQFLHGAIVPANGTVVPGFAVEIGPGINVTAVEGWKVTVLPPGEGVVFEKGDLRLGVHATPFDGTDRTLYDVYTREVLGPKATQMQTLAPVTTLVGRYVGVRGVYLGSFEDSPESVIGQVIALSKGGIGIVFDAVAPPAALARLREEVALVAATLAVDAWR